VRLDILGHEPKILRQLLLTASLILVSCSSGPPPAFHPTCPSGDPLRGIYSPSRLKVLGTCRWFKGTVTEVDQRSDGDQHVLLRPDPGYTQLLDVQNVNAGGMVIEIVPGQRLPVPSVGEHLAVFGTWILDSHNGWNEIHPVWALQNLETGEGTQALPPIPPEYQGSSNH
jgi:hypothetical protein